MKKINEIQLTIHKMDLNKRKMKNHPPSPKYWAIKEVYSDCLLTLHGKTIPPFKWRVYTAGSFISLEIMNNGKYLGSEKFKRILFT